MLRWVLAQHRILFWMVLFSQVLMGIGAAFMYRLYLGQLDPLVAAYLVSGIPALSIIPVGFVMVPIQVIGEKSRGSHEFTWSLPVPRLAPVAAVFTVYATVAIPVAALSTALAAWQFGASLQPTLLALPAALLVSLMATSVGYGLAMAIPEPRITNLILNVVIFVVLLFSPIVIPIERFPDWAATVHRVLPFFHMSNLVRGTVTQGLAVELWASAGVLLAWTTAGWAAVVRVVTRRP
ncbi:MAG: ABC transporter permease [Actinomycetota bacterium]